MSLLASDIVDTLHKCYNSEQLMNRMQKTKNISLRCNVSAIELIELGKVSDWQDVLSENISLCVINNQWIEHKNKKH